MEPREGIRIFINQVRVAVLRFRKGMYSRRWGLFIGFLFATLFFGGGYLVGIGLEYIVGKFLHIKLINFSRNDLTTLWSVHSTIIAFGLVALSFAWNSIQNLPTDPEIIAEIAHRLRSMEVISFLLTSNLIIGIIILWLGENTVPAKLGTPVSVLFFVGFISILQRFWHVLDLLLHNSIDDTVEGFAMDHLSGDFHSPAAEFDSYLGHFFEASRREIDADRPDKLREKLRRVETLLEELTNADDVATDSQLWEFVFSNYDSLYRRCLIRQNEELEQQLIASLSGVFWITMNNWRS